MIALTIVSQQASPAYSLYLDYLHLTTHHTSTQSCYTICAVEHFLVAKCFWVGEDYLQDSVSVCLVRSGLG